MRHKNIGILTGGGDVPGLNSVIKSTVYRATEMNRTVIGIRRGWQGLTHMNPALEQDPDYVQPLTRENTRAIDRTGGTALHTSRTNPAKIRHSELPAHISSTDLAQLRTEEDTLDLTPVVLSNLERLKIGTLIVIGGDDTLRYASRVSREGVPLMAIPKTMDNDVQNTEYCIGFSTAITRAKELITRQRTTLGSHERIGVFRIFGRDSGYTSLYTGYVTSSRCLLPEYPFNLEHLCQLLIGDKRNNPSRYSLVVISEGATWKGRKPVEFGDADAYGHRKKGDIGYALAEEIKARTGVSTLTSDLTYDLRSGDPDSLDHLIAITFANIAMDLISENVSGRMVGIQNGRYAHTAIPDPASGPRLVNVQALYNTDRYRPHYGDKLGSPILLDYL